MDFNFLRQKTKFTEVIVKQNVAKTYEMKMLNLLNFCKVYASSS